MPNRDHNPHKRRLYLPIVSGGGSTGGVTVADPAPETHTAHSVGCAQTVRPARRPPWLRVKARTGPNYTELKELIRAEGLHTVCEEAGCPNIYECWEDREATFLILGDRCTRRCGFCDVMTAKPFPVDRGEPQRVADAVRRMGLRYVVVTGVARDDLDDGGADIWAECIRVVRRAVPGCGVEVLPADFK
ncbi:MAG TPA: lipoyl synthase, partial [Actinomycetota bacterium]